MVAPNKEMIGLNIADVQPLFSKFNADTAELSYTAKIKGTETDLTTLEVKLALTSVGGALGS